MIKQKFTFIFLLTIQSLFLSAQETINQYDADGQRHGKWAKTFENTDQLRYEGQFDHGKEVGLFKYYQLIGRVSKLAATKDFSEVDGSAYVKFFTLGGKLISEGNMMGKTYIGTWKYYHKNSDQLMTLENYDAEGKLQGKRLVYYDNGQVAEELNYIDGRLEGPSKYYSLEGVLVKTYNYENDELHGQAKHFDGNGKLLMEGKYKRGKKHGIWKYYRNGEFIEQKDYSYNPKFKRKN